MNEVLRCFAVAKRWNRWILYNNFQLKHVAVRPDDFNRRGFLKTGWGFQLSR